MKKRKKIYLDSSQWYPMTGQEQQKHRKIQKISPKNKRTHFAVIKYWDRLSRKPSLEILKILLEMYLSNHL